MLGDIAMLDPSKATRMLSAMAKTDCVFLLLNQECFDLIVRVIIIVFLMIYRKNYKKKSKH